MVGKPHGLDGSVHVVGADRPELLASGSVVTVAGAPREILRRAGTPARPIVRLAGCDSRSDAEALRGAELLVPKAAAGALDEDEFWADDLVGCTVVDGPAEVGVVRRLLAYPSCELLEVERAAGGGELLVPMVRDAIRSLDLDARRIDVSLGFLGEEP